MQYNFLKERRDWIKNSEKDIANLATNINRVFLNMPQQYLSDSQAPIDDPNETGTRIIDDGSKKVCLLNGNTTIHGDSVEENKEAVKFNVMLASLSIPAKSVKLLGALIVNGIPKDKYTETVQMIKIGNAWAPIYNTGKPIDNITYTTEKGWCHE